MSRIIYTHHAALRMRERNILRREIHGMLADGEVIENYPQDQPYPSRLLAGCVENRHLHVVAAYDSLLEIEWIITVYEPDPKDWLPGFKVRKWI